MKRGPTVGPCTSKELPRLRKLLNEVFITERNAQGDIFEFAPLLYNEANVVNLRVVRDGRKIVGHAGICVRPIRWRGQLLQAGLIGGVCAREELRGQGIGTLVMQDVAEHMAELGLDFGVLWTGSQAFYERLGWRTMGGISMMRVEEAPGQAECCCELMLLAESPFRPEDCHRLHAEAARSEVVRTPEETQVLMNAAGRVTWLALEGGRLSGYATLTGDTIREIEGDAEVCITLIEHAACEGARRCVFALNDPRIAAVEEALPVDLVRSPLGMFLIVNRDSLVAKIADEAGATPEDLGIGVGESDEVLMERVLGGPDLEPSDAPLPLDIHIGYLDHV